MHPLQANIWDTVALTGTRIQAAIIVTRIATLTVTATTVVMTVTENETPMVVTTVTGVTVVVRLLAMDVTHLITGDVGVIQEARREVAALARIMMVLPMVPLIPPTMPRMAAVGEVTSCGLNMSCSIFICLFLAKGRARTNEGFMADNHQQTSSLPKFLVTSCLEEASTWFDISQKKKNQVSSFLSTFLACFPPSCLSYRSTTLCYTIKYCEDAMVKFTMCR